MVIATLALLVLILPALTPNGVPAKRIHCVNNLKQIGLAFRMFANDHGDEFPWRVPGAKGGAAEAADMGNILPSYQAISNELVNPKPLWCPTDLQREAANDYGRVSNANLSYFICREGHDGYPDTIITGDRNITGGTISNGALVLSLVKEAGWDTKLHNSVGNIGLADGSTLQVTPALLNAQLQKMATKGIDTVHLLNP